MRGKRKKSRLAGALTALLGFVCALILGALFYGTMVYQLAGEESKAPAPMGMAQPDAGAPVSGVAFPGRLLALGEGVLEGGESLFTVDAELLRALLKG